MHNLPLTSISMALMLSACNGGNLLTNQTTSNASSLADVTGKALEDTTQNPVAGGISPRANCGSAEGNTNGENILGIVVGISPDEATKILACRGYEISFPANGRDRQNVEQEEKQGYFRRDFRLTDGQDFIRIFMEGPRGRQKVFAIGRAKIFGDNDAPTVDAVAQQYVESYHPVGGVTKDHIGITEAARFDYVTNPVRLSPDQVVRHCSELASLHNPDDRFSPIMNTAPYPDANCGASMTLQLIPNGKNENLAYLVRYRMANPQLGNQLREARVSGEQTAAQARLEAETRQAQENGKLPDL